MRGSPLFRTLAVAIALILAAAGLTLLGHQPSHPPAPVGPSPAGPTSATRVPASFILTLSDPAESVVLETGGKTVTLNPDQLRQAGTLMLETGHPRVFIDVTWSDSAPRSRFVKLVLEPEGHPTLTRYFDAPGAIADVWEIHLHP